MSQLLDDLKAIRALLTPEGAWTQGVAARDASGRRCETYSSRVRSRCIITATDHSVKGYSLVSRRMAVYAALESVTGNLYCFNEADGRTQAEVLALVDAAIAREEGR